jgi:hypothetical protein
MSLAVCAAVLTALWLGLHLYTAWWRSEPETALLAVSDRVRALQSRVAALEREAAAVREFDKDTVRLQRVAKAAALLRPFGAAQRAVANLSLSELDAVVRWLRHPSAAQAHMIARAFDDDADAHIAAQFAAERADFKRLIDAAQRDRNSLPADAPGDDELWQLQQKG